MRCRSPLKPRASRIVLILMDVDGVMTDGGICLLESGRETKTFNAKDGVALWTARRIGLKTGVITGRRSAAVTRRAKELRMNEVHLGCRDKLAAYVEILRRRRLSDAQVCYIGDDLVDLPILGRAGMPVAVSDAHPEVLRRARFITSAGGGRGAVREVVDEILKAQGHWDTVLGWFNASPAGRRRGPRRPPR